MAKADCKEFEKNCIEFRQDADEGVVFKDSDDEMRTRFAWSICTCQKYSHVAIFEMRRERAGICSNAPA